MVEVSLQCAIVGQAGSSFDVEIDDGVKVSKFKTAIKKVNEDDPILKQFAPKNLKLFLAKKDGAWLSSSTEDVKQLKKGEKTAFVEALTIDKLELDGESALKKCLNGMPQPSTDEIHVLVVIPREMAFYPFELRDSSHEWLSDFFTKTVEFDSLPFVGNLRNFVAQPLPVKFRAKKKWLDNWNLRPELQEKIFVLDDAAPCMEYKGLLFNDRALRPLRRGQTESSYICLWDLVFRNVLDLIFTRARIDRDSCKGSSTRKKRPDFLFVLDGVCVFRGEEKSPGVSVSVAAEELLSKLVWVYGSVPYVFGYAASGYTIDLFALHRDANGVVTKTIIGAFNFELKEHLFEAILAMLNLSLLFPAIVESCPASGKDEFGDISRSNGVIVRLYPTFVEKKFPDTSSFDHLRRVYADMERAGIPNVDRLTQLRFKKNSAVFEPRGTMVRPSNLIELFGALRDVLRALTSLHSLGWMHRDIRWSNVIMQREGGSWFLIDFADAATSPQQSSSDHDLSVEEHAPEIFVNNGFHTTAVDIWSVGFLIETSGLNQEWMDFAGRSSLHTRLIAKDPAARPNAEDALADLAALQEAAEREQAANRELQQGGNSRKSRKQSRKRKL